MWLQRLAANALACYLLSSAVRTMSCFVNRHLPAVLQVNVSANHLINSARLLSQPSQQRFLQALAPLDVLQATSPVAAADHEHAGAAATAQQAAVGTGNAAQQQHAAEPQVGAPGTNQQQQQQQQQQQRESLESQQLQQSGGVDTAVVTGDEYYTAKDR
jgi:hypothetical protein